MLVGGLVGDRRAVGPTSAYQPPCSSSWNRPRSGGQPVVDERRRSPAGPAGGRARRRGSSGSVTHSSTGRARSRDAGLVQPGEPAVGMARGAAEREEPVALGLEPAGVGRSAQPGHVSPLGSGAWTRTACRSGSVWWGRATGRASCTRSGWRAIPTPSWPRSGAGTRARPRRWPASTARRPTPATRATTRCSPTWTRWSSRCRRTCRHRSPSARRRAAGTCCWRSRWR